MKDGLIAVFLDRDGTIIEDLHYPREPEKVSLTPNASEGLRLMNSKGYLLFVVSNQSGVGRGIIKDNEFKAVHEKTCELLKAQNVEIAEFAYCFHLPEDHCSCRKPKPGLVLPQFQGHPIDFARSFVVGDKECDLELADNIRASGNLVLTGKGAGTRERLRQLGLENKYRVFPDLLAVAESLPVH
jgi:D-glycero-D-manno-heptose 1,7-bisphosphate phosphatase